jgi:hypothetical protein
MTITTVKSQIAKEDIALATGNSGADETFSRRTSAGAPATFTKLDATHLKMQATTGSVESNILTLLAQTTGIPGVQLTSAFAKLRVKNNTVTPATKIDIDADVIMVTDGTSLRALAAFSKTVDCTVTGVNGLDTGALATGWYYFYAIAKADGTAAGLASTSGTAPTMPSGYTYKKLVSTLYYFTGFYSFNQINKKVNYNAAHVLYLQVTSSGYDMRSLQYIIPSNAVKVVAQAISDNVTYNCCHFISWDNVGALNNIGIIMANAVTPSGGYYAMSVPFEYVLNPDAPQTIYVHGADSHDRGRSFCLGYELDI